VPPLERVVYRREGVEIGAFRCPPQRSDFRRAGPIRDHCAFVFPRTAVRIRHEGVPAFAADAGTVTFYNPGQPYERELLDPAGDCCEWFALPAPVAAEVAQAVDAGAGDEGAPLRFTHGPSDARTYLHQRALFAALERGHALDPLTVEEALLGLLASVLRQAAAARGERERGRADLLSGRERRAVEAARALLARDFRRPLTLEHVARAVGLSRYRLCRAFRTATGTTLHAHRDQLRLRAALDPLSGGCADLTSLALDLGYSSHSHFSERFRHAFGLTPSQARARL